MTGVLIGLGIVVLLLILLFFASVRVVNEYDSRVRSRLVTNDPHGRSTSFRW